MKVPAKLQHLEGPAVTLVAWGGLMWLQSRIWFDARTEPGYFSDQGRMIWDGYRFTMLELSLESLGTVAACLVLFMACESLAWRLTSFAMSMMALGVLFWVMGPYVPDRPNAPFWLGVTAIFGGVIATGGMIKNIVPGEEPNENART